MSVLSDFMTSQNLNATPTSYTQAGVSPYAQPLANQVVNQAQALGSAPMPQFTGELAAGPSQLQNQAFQGLANLTLPSGMAAAGNNLGSVATQAQNIGNTFTPTTFTNQNFTSDAAQQYMNPYLQASLQPQLQLLNQQLGQQNSQLGATMAQAGAFGGGRQAIEESQNALNNNLAANSLISSGYNTAYNNAMNQFNADQARNLQTQQAQETANQYQSSLGLQGLQAATTANQALGQNATNQAQYGLADVQAQEKAGSEQQALAQAADTASYNQYLQQLQYPQQMLKMQSGILAALPSSTSAIYGQAPSTSQNLVGAGGTVASLVNDLPALQTAYDSLKGFFGTGG